MIKEKVSFETLTQERYNKLKNYKFGEEYKTYQMSGCILEIFKRVPVKSVFGKITTQFMKVAVFDSYNLIVRVYVGSEYEKMKTFAEELCYKEIERNFTIDEKKHDS